MEKKLYHQHNNLKITQASRIQDFIKKTLPDVYSFRNPFKENNQYNLQNKFQKKYVFKFLTN